ncbi:type II toxin-antitoxin system RelE/ParE family toxin [Streptomyces sp. NPDC048258]|uniref:type II toxin-antitoxin system RelE family toxin n=1 Tax=Streptomyces sp. NPDC048258 TaxID=3365527 RepID=UPI00371A32DC
MTVDRALELITADPYTHRSKRLLDPAWKGARSVRAGDDRVIYRIESGRPQILRIAHRRIAYRRPCT